MFAQEKNTFSAPKIRIRTKASTLTAVSRVIALSGVFRDGATLPNAFGRTPDRPIAYHVRVPPLKQAIETAIAEFSRAKRSKTHAPPQTRCASVATGHAVAVGILSTLSTPMPTRYPHVTKRKYTIRIRTDPTSAIGTLRFGSLLSSASGAAASHPL